MTGHVSIGVDVGGTTTRIVAFGAAGEVLGESVSPTPQGAEAVIAAIVAGVAQVADGAGPVRHVGVGIPGQVVGDGSVALALNVGITTPVPLGDRLGAALGVPVVVENDVNAAALATLAALDDGNSLTYVSIGTGFAVGSIVDGVIVRGATGVAGEIGHVPIPGETVPCVCGQRGCIEALLSGRALSEAGAALGLGSADVAPTVVDVWDAADAGRSGAVALRTRTVEALTWVCQVSVLMLDAGHVVFGGGVSELGERLLAPVRAALQEREAQSPWLAAVGPSRRLRRAPTDGHLGAIGADLSARQRVEAARV